MPQHTSLFQLLDLWLKDNDPHTLIPIPSAAYPPNDMAEYRKFVEAVLRHLVEVLELPPERIVVEVLNEPGLGCSADLVAPRSCENWTMDEIACAVWFAYKVIQTVNTDIRLVALAECCGTGVVRNEANAYLSLGPREDVPP
jgi:hypothetical protein